MSAPHVDVNACIGGYPWRHVPHPDADVLARVVAREGLAGAWVGHLPSAFWRDPEPGNAELFAALAPHGVLRAVPCVRPDWPGWERRLAAVAARGAVAVRVYPALWGLGAGDAGLERMARACAEAGLAVVLSVRFEDVRQRHPLDAAPDLQPAHVRALARARTGARVVVVNGGDDFVREVVWGLTVEEREPLWFDFSWLWGAPEDQFAAALRSVGPQHFVYGTAWPLRLTQNARALLDLLPGDVRAAGDAIARAPMRAEPRSGAHLPNAAGTFRRAGTLPAP